MLFKRKNGGIVEAKNNYEASILMSNKDYTPFENVEKCEKNAQKSKKNVKNVEDIHNESTINVQNVNKSAKNEEVKASKEKDGE